MAAHRTPTRAQLVADTRQLADLGREWAATAAYAARLAVHSAAEVIAQVIVLATTVALVILMTGAGR
jgi:hypothetical protein